MERGTARRAGGFELLRAAERVEHAAAALYQALADGAAGAERELYRRLAAEELQHVARVRLLGSHYRNGARALDLGLPSLAPLEAAERAHLDLLEELRAGRCAPGEALARRLAALEVQTGTAHAEVLAQVADPDLARFLRELAAQDAGHAQLLVGVDRRGGGR